jgi:hypothetical protein
VRHVNKVGGPPARGAKVGERRQQDADHDAAAHVAVRQRRDEGEAADGDGGLEREEVAHRDHRLRVGDDNAGGLEADEGEQQAHPDDRRELDAVGDDGEDNVESTDDGEDGDERRGGHAAGEGGVDGDVRAQHLGVHEVRVEAHPWGDAKRHVAPEAQQQGGGHAGEGGGGDDLLGGEACKEGRGVGKEGGLFRGCRGRA